MDLNFSLLLGGKISRTTTLILQLTWCTCIHKYNYIIIKTPYKTPNQHWSCIACKLLVLWRACFDFKPFQSSLHVPKHSITATKYLDLRHPNFALVALCAARAASNFVIFHPEVLPGGSNPSHRPVPTGAVKRFVGFFFGIRSYLAALKSKKHSGFWAAAWIVNKGGRLKKCEWIFFLGFTQRKVDFTSPKFGHRLTWPCDFTSSLKKHTYRWIKTIHGTSRSNLSFSTFCSKALKRHIQVTCNLGPSDWKKGTQKNNPHFEGKL